MIDDFNIPIGCAAGCLPRDDLLGADFPVFEDVIQPIPEDEWPDRIAAQTDTLDDLVAKIKDQGQEGSCASNAVTGAAETVGNLLWGMDQWIELSAMSVYRQPGVGRSPSSGSTIGSNLRAMRDVGALPVDNAANRERFVHTHPARGFHISLPRGYEETAALFRIHETYDIRTWSGLVTAVLRKFPVVYGRAGHAIYGVKIVWQNGRAYLVYANSWRASWGANGRGTDSERAVAGSIRSYGAFAIRSRIVPDWILAAGDN